jgi:hypothetical protein
MRKIKDSDNLIVDDNIGLILWKLESIEKFYPCYNSMLKKE